MLDDETKQEIEHIMKRMLKEYDACFRMLADSCPEWVGINGRRYYCQRGLKAHKWHHYWSAELVSEWGVPHGRRRRNG